MGQWLYRVDLKEEWKRFEAGEITVYESAQLVIGKLKELHQKHKRRISFQENLLLMAIEDLESLEEDCVVGEFDYILDDVYDWADEVRCWVATF